MADDLIVKFFREDLTEAEEEALSQRLSSSVEDALRLGQHAEASYRHYGLPEPKWTGGPPPGFYPKSGFKFGLWLPVVLLAGLAAWVGWRYWLDKENKLSAPVPAPSASLALSHPSGKKAGHSAARRSQEVIPGRLEDKSIQDPKALVAATASSGVLNNMRPALTPVNAAGQPHHPYSNLEVVVKRTKAGEVTVRVLQPDGSQAVMLYQGSLQPGSWIFDWNGRLADGGAPPSGTYQIQVVSGPVTMNKAVVIQK